MNNNTYHAPQGEINFQEFNPPTIKTQGNINRNDRKSHNRKQMIAEYNRVKRRLIHLEKLLKIKPGEIPTDTRVDEKAPKNPSVRFGNNFRGYKAKEKYQKEKFHIVKEEGKADNTDFLESNTVTSA